MSVNGGREESSGDSYNGQLLRDIKEVSKALYLNNRPERSVLSLSPPVRSKSVSRTTEIGLVLSNKKKKSLVPWDWKRPLKAIAHFGQRRFDVCFLLHVHSIEGLPLNMDGTKLVVQWKRKDEVMSTQPCNVLQGNAEFEETLMHRCSVYGSKHGPHRSAKYQVKLFLVYVSPVDAPWLVLGKHWVDLTRILPLSLEELEDTRSSRKWNTSFKLSGLAKSAVLNLSFDYSVVTSSVCDSTSGNVMLKRVGSVPSVDHRSSLLDDGKVFNQVSPSPSLDLSKSIDFLYEKFSEQNSQRSTGIEIQYEHKGETKVGLGLETDDKQADDSGDTEFVFTEKGVEMFQKERSILEENTDPNAESSRIEIIDVHEILKEEDELLFEESHFIDQLSVAEPKNGPSNILPNHSVDGASKSAFSSKVLSESSEIKSSLTMEDSTENNIFLEVKSSYKAAKISTKSLSLDDITESVANDFLKMLELEECSYVYTSDGEPTSPRGSLLREFEKEALASGNFLLDIDGDAEYVSDIDEESNDFSFSASSLGVGENKRERKSQLLIDTSKAKVLEDLETETLLRDWDLDDDSFGNSLSVCSDGFGSPIELPDEEGVDLLPFGDYISRSAWKKGGGYIRSINPLLFRKCKDASHDSHLIMQVSIPLVLVSVLGSDILEILQSLAASGIEGLCSEVNALMPLEDIMGKMIHEVVDDARFERIGHDWSDNSKGVVVQKPTGQLDLFPSNEEFGGFGSNMCPSYVPLEHIASLAIDEIYLLAVEGLKIQCSMSDQDPPSGISPKPMDQSDALELMSFSLPLDEWLRLDHGMPDNKDQTSKQMGNKILVHHAYQDQASSGKGHMLRSELTLALQVLLRDPFRTNEPVGASMLALIQVERSLDSSYPSVCSLAQEVGKKGSPGYDSQLWRITSIGLAGLKTEHGVDHPWCTKTQQQSGYRWLIASGTDKTIKCQASESKAIIVSNAQATRYSLDSLWSITSDGHHQEGDSSSSDTSVSFTRNLDVIFSKELTERS
ncbi:PREDICTED: protein PLASTID MOVEMENT IMPAIRED 1-RELATED 2-like [Camelina sativa]|uniref:Protein PLASTID MOVEMENT IMPAIRED 1-RELATED 2-like n=1 Tax=Camelina sativa TaxID=90675 RepID=A0ABM1RDX7_CAMSA|nr:PREDICTED: protein PLASTID MOVEMENT IMPAIRED 1-RELATED 2-like [Camelina sativa]XP_019097215.1 PREDICTED: protein PLASTID MOVEMENT IMPAIRED 1-RELATED 2-like [Camelina sativa]XP_019097216.1 PREDICTED: protein PLASTID MOVEMENT IMPAIRED 1-RELATED 2-like [Camelina sativa]